MDKELLENSKKLIEADRSVDTTTLRRSSKSTFQPDHPLFEPSRFKYLPLVVLFLLLLNLLATCTNTRTSRMAAKNQPYIYVQTPDGNTVKAKPVDPLYRSDAVIANFTKNWLKLAYTWKTPPQKGKAFVSERGIDFPYQFHEASIAIVPGYRESYMDSQAKKYEREFSFSDYISGRYQSYLRIVEDEDKSKPKIEQVSKGIWDVTVVATRIHAQGNSIFAYEVFNRVIRIQAIKPACNEQKLWGDRETALGRMLNEMQCSGFQILEIAEF
ncbi:MAG: hypothetical protein HC820_03830 [Hydrococcus sp. RM1_1_31]|nr:hypothetical protein [Hydrococcus sp. RM1_1_31]